MPVMQVNFSEASVEDVKKRLIDRRLTVVDLARRVRKSRVAVSAVIHKRRDYPQVRALIAKELGYDD